MSSRSYMARGLTALVLLGMTSCLAGCQSLSTTHTSAIEVDKAIAAKVCSEWLPVTYSSQDTEQTRLEARANNAARDAYCG